MSLARFRSTNHPQQLAVRGAEDSVDDRMVNPGLFAPLDLRFGFTIDVAASEANTRCARFYDRDTDGLAQSWAGEVVWCNPPYSAIAPWVAKAWAECGSALTIVMLLPANRTEQGWWHAMVEPFRDRNRSPLAVEFIKDRQRFVRPGQSHFEPNNRPPFGCCLLIWQPLVFRPDDIRGGLFEEIS